MKTNKVDGDIIISTEEGLHSRISGNRSWEEMEVSTSDLMEGPSILAQPTAEDNIIDTNYNHDVTVPSSRPSLVKSTPSEAENDKLEEKNSPSADSSVSSQKLFTSASKDDYDIDDGVVASTSTPIGINEILCDKPNSSCVTVSSTLSSSSSSSSNSADSIDDHNVAKEDGYAMDIPRTRY